MIRAITPHRILTEPSVPARASVAVTNVRLAPAAATDAPCPAPPSATAALDLLHGRPGAAGHVAVSLAGRAAIIALGMAAAGQRDGLVKASLGGASVIEAVVIGYLYLTAQHKKLPPGTCPPFATSEALDRLLRGDIGAMPKVALDVAGRAAMIYAGARLVQGRGARALPALGGSLSVTAFMALWILGSRVKELETARALVPGARAAVALPPGPSR